MNEPLRRGRLNLRRHVTPPPTPALRENLLLKIDPYFSGFNDQEDVYTRFNAENEGHRVIFALYWTGDYEGAAWVLLHKDGQLFEVNGSHCSCNGLEECWGLETTFFSAVETFLDNSRIFDDKEDVTALHAIIDQLKSIANQAPEDAP